VPSGGVTLKRRCTYRPSVIYLIVNKLLSLSLSHSLTLSLSETKEVNDTNRPKRSHTRRAIRSPADFLFFFAGIDFLFFLPALTFFFKKKTDYTCTKD